MKVFPFLCAVIVLAYLSFTFYFYTSNEIGDTALQDTLRSLRQQNLKQYIRYQRELSERWWARARDAERAADNSEARVKSRCDAYAEWKDEVPCTVPALNQTYVIITDHFQPYNESFMVPHYDELDGNWTVSSSVIQLWGISTRNPADVRRILCGELWLSFTDTFAPLGSLSRTHLLLFEAKAKQLTVFRNPANLASKIFRNYLLAMLTRQAAYLEGVQLTPTLVGKLIEGLHVDNMTKPSKALLQDFADGLGYALDVLVPTPFHEWTLENINEVQKRICKSENPPLLGQTRYGKHNIAYGLSIPNGLGYEVPQLMATFLHWLRRVGKRKCQHPILTAFHVFVTFYNIHPYMNCNTRTSQVLLNSILMQHKYPPMQLLLFENKRGLRTLQDSAAKGLRRDFYDLLLKRLLGSVELVLQYEYLMRDTIVP